MQNKQNSVLVNLFGVRSGKVGTHPVEASYIPHDDSAFLPSSSRDEIHIVKRCFCGTPEQPAKRCNLA